MLMQREEVQHELTVTLLAMTELVRKYPQPHNTPQGVDAWKRSLPWEQRAVWTQLRQVLEGLRPDMERANVRISQTDADWLYWSVLLLPVEVIARAAGMDPVEFSRSVKSRHLKQDCPKCGAKRWVRNRAEYKEEWKHEQCRGCRKPAIPTQKGVKPRKLYQLELDALRWLLSRQHGSNFLESLKRQVKEWCHAPVKHRDAPLSPRQFECLFQTFYTWQTSEEYVEAQRRKTQPSLN